MADIQNISGFTPQDLPVVNENYRVLNEDKWEVKYFSTAPTSADLNQRQLGVYDDGVTRELYFKSHLGTLLKITAAVA
jgi:hypothetical protein